MNLWGKIHMNLTKILLFGNLLRIFGDAIHVNFYGEGKNFLIYVNLTKILFFEISTLPLTFSQMEGEVMFLYLG